MYGAINKVLSGTPQWTMDTLGLSNKWPEVLGFTHPDNLVHWNNNPERTKAEVLDRFDAAIAKLS
jgi:hypothetical protein